MTDTLVEFWVTVANVPSRAPRLTKAQSGPAIDAVFKYAKRGGFICWSEISVPYFLTQILAHTPEGWVTCHAGNPDSPLTYDSHVWEPVKGTVHTYFGSAGIPWIAPTRHDVGGLFRHKTTGKIVAGDALHMTPRAYSPAPMKPALRELDQLRWKRHQKRLMVRVAKWKQQAVLTFLGGDANRVGTFTFPSLHRGAPGGVTATWATTKAKAVRHINIRHLDHAVVSSLYEC